MAAEMKVTDSALQAAMDAAQTFASANTVSMYATAADLLREEMHAALEAGLSAMLEPVAYGVLTSWDGTDKAEVRDIRFTSDEAEGAAYHAQNKIPKGFPVTVTAVPLYRIKEPK